MSAPGSGGHGTPTDERDRLIAAFIELMAEHGFQGVDRASVCQRAELGRRAFERHFPDRLACFAAAWTRLEKEYLSRVAVAYEGHRGWRAQLHAAAAETIRLVEAHPSQARFLVVETLAMGGPGRERQRMLAATLARQLDRARAQLVDPAAPPAATAGWIVGIFFDRIFRSLWAGTEAELTSQLPQLMFIAVSSFGGAEAGLAELRPPPP